ncbi:MAG: hypothetical protein PVI30_23745 [Myxococcales bacterium]
MHNQSPHLASLPALLALLALLAGCSGDAASSVRRDAPTGDTSSPVRSGNSGTLLFNNTSTGTACAAANLTRACDCEGTPGRQICGGNQVWGACECLDPLAGTGSGAAGAGGGGGSPLASFADPPENDLPARFEWLRTEPGSSGGGCQPGLYAGSLDGLYNAPSAFNAPVPIVSVDVTGAPGLQLDLASSGNGEFLEVRGGSLNGTALAIFPFEAEFADGQLDCSTGEFRARIINGTYVVFFDGFYGGSTVYQFEGEAVARYDATTSSLVDGRWAVSEGATVPPAISPDQPPPVFPPAQAGGTGTWTATLSP